MKIKLLIISTFFTLLSQQGFCQNELMTGLKGINSVNDAIEKIFNFFTSTTNSQNKEKLKTMSVGLYLDIEKIILAKDSVIQVLQESAPEKAKYLKCFSNLQNKLLKFSDNVRRYHGLIAECDINAAKLQSDIQEDLFSKNQLLIKAIQNIKTPEYPNLKDDLITYLKSSVIILKNAQATLSKFKVGS